MSTPFEGARTVTDRKAGGTGGRLETLDMIRGLTIISMVLYHGMWDLLYLSRFGAEMSTARMWYEGIGGHLWQQSICRSFILLAGFCVPFSKHIFRRGLLVSACGILVSAVTVFAMYEERVLFGVLTFHGAAMLLAGAGRQIKKGRSEQLCGWRTAEDKFSGRPVKPAAAADSTGGLTKPAAGVLLSAFFFHVTRWVNRGYLQLGPFFRLALPAFLYKREGAGGLDPDSRGLSDERIFLYGLFFPDSVDLPFSDRNLSLQADGKGKSVFEAGFSSEGTAPEPDRTIFPADLSAASAAAVSAGERVFLKTPAAGGSGSGSRSSNENYLKTRERESET